MGFYAPAQLVSDAKDHGVQVAGVDVNHSDWDCTLEPVVSAAPLKPLERPDYCNCDWGLRMVRGLAADIGRTVVLARETNGAFRDLADFTRTHAIGTGIDYSIGGCGRVGFVDWRSSRRLLAIARTGSNCEGHVLVRSHRRGQRRSAAGDFATDAAD